MKKTIILAALVGLLVSCTGKTKTETSKEADVKCSTEQVTERVTPSCCSAELTGVYKGMLPAASSPGIKTELTLNTDKTFILVSEFLEEKDGKFTDKGAFEFSDGILTTTTDGGSIAYYKVEENQLRMLNQDKQEITGELAASYVLKKAE